MRIGFNARLLSDPGLRGWNRYTLNLISGLINLGVEPILYSDRPCAPGHLARLAPAVLESVSPSMPYDRWEQFWLPRQCKRDGVAVLHSPFNFGLPWSSPCPRVLTLHDAIDQIHIAKTSKARTSFTHFRERLRHWIARTRADKIITVSAHARDDLVGILRLPAKKVVVIPEAADPIFQQPVTLLDTTRVRSQFCLENPYFFYVGGWEERKNIPYLLKAFERAKLENVDLVLAGGKEHQRSEFNDLAESLGIANRLKMLGFIPEADLPALYAGALAFVYPSVYEGFGLQLCEAMSVGIPVLSSNATSLPEVLGAGGETFAPDDPATLATLLERVAHDPTFQAELRARSSKRARDFSWEVTAKATLDVYRQLGAR